MSWGHQGGIPPIQTIRAGLAVSSARKGLHTGDVGSRRAHARFVSAGGMPAHGVHGACIRAGNIPEGTSARAIAWIST